MAVVRAPEWTEDEFEVVLRGYGLCHQEVAGTLPGGRRSPGAVGVVREGIHSFHKGHNISMLSKMMLRYLEHRRGTLICPKCGAKL